MKLVSWNVNGLRACYKHGFADAFSQIDADIFCLQETRMEQGQAAIDFSGYHETWYSAEKKGYSGTAVFSKIEPNNSFFGMNVDEHDHEGRLITLEYEKFFLVNVYVPNSQDELRRLEYRMRWEDDFRRYIVNLDKSKPVIICGDLNCAHTEMDIKNAKANVRTHGFTQEERDKLTELLAEGFTDFYRDLNPKKSDAYTWWSTRPGVRERNVGWRIDYFLGSDRLKPNVSGAGIYPDIYGSDHCPVWLELGNR